MAIVADSEGYLWELSTHQRGVELAAWGATGNATAAWVTGS